MKGFPGFAQTTNSDVVDWPNIDRDGFIIKNGRYLNWTQRRQQRLLLSQPAAHVPHRRRARTDR